MFYFLCSFICIFLHFNMWVVYMMMEVFIVCGLPTVLIFTSRTREKVSAVFYCVTLDISAFICDLMSAKMKLLPSSLLAAYVNEKWQNDLPSLGYKLSPQLCFHSANRWEERHIFLSMVTLITHKVGNVVNKSLWRDENTGYLWAELWQMTVSRK